MKDNKTRNEEERYDDNENINLEGDNNENSEGNAEVVDATTEEEESTPEQEIDKLNEELAKEKKEYMFLMAEFDNFRKRTLREKSDIIKNAGETVLKGLLPILDDFERGLKASESADDPASIREGMELIYNKLKKYLAQNGVKEFDPDDKTFDADKHEAISVVPVPDEKNKGKILDTVEKGYMINDKVLRHAKVVVGQ
ncbi:MAG: nucleotide exchange factor GrpE [Prevotella sp.]|nr:nucleotide exchange factor GrpE [Bacteroides sp.]MCM1366295.1 nucleotide exchange factor GrpE [Prevotella sp.]MCM1437099.1 nucleotide exchange factor GrpE [Prevotella sp.]